MTVCQVGHSSQCLWPSCIQVFCLYGLANTIEMFSRWFLLQHGERTSGNDLLFKQLVVNSLNSKCNKILHLSWLVTTVAWGLNQTYINLIPGLIPQPWNALATQVNQQVYNKHNQWLAQCSSHISTKHCHLFSHFFTQYLSM